MSPILESKLRQIMARLKMLKAEQMVSRFVLFGLLLCLVLILIDKVKILPINMYLAIILVILVSSALGGLITLFYKVNHLQAAKLADRRLGLKERLASAVEFQTRGKAGGFIDALIDDAEGHAGGVDAKLVSPHRLPREAKLAMGMVIPILALAILPQFQSPEHKALSAAMQKEGKRIVVLSKKMEGKAKRHKLQLTQKFAHKLHKLGKRLTKGGISKRQALRKLAKLSAELKEAHKRLAIQNYQRSLAKALQELGKSKALKGLGESIETGDYKALQKSLKELGDKIAKGELSREQLKGLQAELTKVGKALEGTAFEDMGSKLQAAGKALSEQSTEAACKALSEAAQAGEMAAGKLLEAKSLAQAATEIELSEQEIASADQICECCGKPKGICACKTGTCAVCGGAGGLAGVGPEAGYGTTNLKGPEGPMGPGFKRDRLSSKRTHQRAKFERIYAPERIATERFDTKVKGKLGKGKSYVTKIRGKPDKEEAYAPYYEVYPSFRQVAEDALNREDIPIGYKKYVKDYFESIKP